MNTLRLIHRRLAPLARRNGSAATTCRLVGVMNTQFRATRYWNVGVHSSPLPGKRILGNVK